jgi:hypothetical protein
VRVPVARPLAARFAPLPARALPDRDAVRYVRAMRAALVLTLAVASPLAVAELARSPDEFLTRMDANGDGRVGVREYQTYLSRGFFAMDRNGDDVVSVDELPPGTANARSRPLSLTEHESRVAQTFRRQDRDGSGWLDARELAAPPR